MLNQAQELIFDRYKNPQLSGYLPHATHQAKGTNPLCGDELTILLQLDDNQTILQARHQTRACAICTAATDFLVETIVNKSLPEAITTAPELILDFLEVPLSPIRQKCALLPLQALQQITLEQA